MVVFPRESWAKLHLQFIYFGREHCQVTDGRHTTYARVVAAAVQKASGEEKSIAERV